jgi:hypothetical protein
MLKIFEYNDFNDSLYKNIKIIVIECSWINVFYRYILTCAEFYKVTRDKEFICYERIRVH